MIVSLGTIPSNLARLNEIKLYQLFNIDLFLMRQYPKINTHKLFVSVGNVPAIWQDKIQVTLYYLTYTFSEFKNIRI